MVRLSCGSLWTWQNSPSNADVVLFASQNVLSREDHAGFAKLYVTMTFEFFLFQVCLRSVKDWYWAASLRYHVVAAFERGNVRDSCGWASECCPGGDLAQSYAQLPSYATLPDPIGTSWTPDPIWITSQYYRIGPSGIPFLQSQCTMQHNPQCLRRLSWRSWVVSAYVCFVFWGLQVEHCASSLRRTRQRPENHGKPQLTL